MSSALATFVRGLDQSALLDAKQRAEVTRLHAKVEDVRTLAQELLRRQWLTAYQINQIAQGSAAELTIGRYVLLERLGAGAMGQVFKACQKPLDRLVALKIIRKECLDNPKAIKRFQREIRAASKLCHPHIVRAVDAGQIGATYYFAMELIEGTDLSKLVNEKGPLRVDQACEYIRQAALGLQHASEHGLVHRDIKPANLLVTHAITTEQQRATGNKRGAALARRTLANYPWGAVKILDMGLALCADSTGRGATQLTQIGSVMGTPDFIAPEQARDSHSADIRADLYSLGCTLYFLLTGQPPFPTGTLTDKLLQHQFDAAEPLTWVRRQRLGDEFGGAELIHVPAAVEDVVARLMAKDPADRFQTPRELAKTLQTLIKHMADGTLARAEAVGRTKTRVHQNTVADPAAAVESKFGNASATVEPVVPVARELRRAKPTIGKRPVLWALCGGVCVVLLATMIAAVIGASSRTQATPTEVDTSLKK